jgi:hypothetical protein
MITFYGHAALRCEKVILKRSPPGKVPNLFKIQPFHQALYRTPAYFNPFSAHPPPDFTGTVYPEISFIHTTDLDFQL